MVRAPPSLHSLFPSLLQWVFKVLKLLESECYKSWLLSYFLHHKIKHCCKLYIIAPNGVLQEMVTNKNFQYSLWFWHGEFDGRIVHGVTKSRTWLSKFHNTQWFLEAVYGWGKRLIPVLSSGGNHISSQWTTKNYHSFIILSLVQNSHRNLPICWGQGAEYKRQSLWDDFDIANGKETDEPIQNMMLFFSVKWRNEVIGGISVESGIAIKISLWEPFWAETQMMWNCKPSKIDPEMFQAEGQQLWISGDKTSARCTGNRKWGRLVSNQVKDAGGGGGSHLPELCR